MSDRIEKQACLDDEQILQYSRHLLLNAMDDTKQLAIINAKILVVGAGGLGCAVLPYLVAAGVGSVTVVDGDQVDLSNCHRQILHTQDDIGRAKVVSAADKLQPLNQHAQLICENHFFTDDDESMVEAADVVIDCSDNLSTRNLLNRLCFKHKTPLVSGSAIRFEGQLITLDMQPDSACYGCFSHLFGGDELSCSQSGVFSPIVGVIGALQATEALKLIAQVGQPSVNKLWLFDGLTMDFRSIKVNKNLTCDVCS